MRVVIALSLLLLGCNQLGELGDEPEQDESFTIDPEQEREADEFNKLGVERDLLEAKLNSTNEALAEAEDQLRDAKNDQQKKAAAKNKKSAQNAQRKAKKALDAFLAGSR